MAKSKKSNLHAIFKEFLSCIPKKDLKTTLNFDEILQNLDGENDFSDDLSSLFASALDISKFGIAHKAPTFEETAPSAPKAGNDDFAFRLDLGGEPSLGPEQKITENKKDTDSSTVAKMELASEPLFDSSFFSFKGNLAGENPFQTGLGLGAGIQEETTAENLSWTGAARMDLTLDPDFPAGFNFDEEPAEEKGFKRKA